MNPFKITSLWSDNPTPRTNLDSTNNTADEMFCIIGCLGYNVDAPYL
jgi:hypothetical protein